MKTEIYYGGSVEECMDRLKKKGCNVVITIHQDFIKANACPDLPSPDTQILIYGINNFEDLQYATFSTYGYARFSYKGASVEPPIAIYFNGIYEAIPFDELSASFTGRATFINLKQ